MTVRIRNWPADRVLAVVCSLVFAVLGITLVMPFLLDQKTPVLRMSAGPDSTRRHEMAAYLSEQAAHNDLSIELMTSASSEDCLSRLKAGQLDVAVVSSGVIVPDDEDIRVLGALQLEAVHLLVRKRMAEGGPLLKTIRGSRVNLGEVGSTERLLAQEFLAFARLRLPSASHPGDVIPTEYSKEYLIDKSRAILRADGAERDALIAELPDCVMVVAALPSKVVQLLFETGDYRLLPLPATRAFLLDNLQDDSARTTVLRREYLEQALIPAHSYFAETGFPETDCETVGVRMLVVANKNLSADVVEPLMKTVFDGEFPRRIPPKSPRDLATPYAIHPAALAYLDRDKPLAIDAVLEWLSNGLSVFGAFSAGALSLYSLLWRKRAQKSSGYYVEIRQVEQLAMDADLDSTPPIQRKELLKQLDDRLLGLRQDLIADVCEGRIKGDQVISNILTLLKDARRNLTNREPQASHSRDSLSHNYRLSEKAA